ncbi:Up-regulated during septation-domain-containing protein, partial [Coniella lustricola]
MAQSNPRQYQLFPSSRQSTPSPVQGLDPEQAFAVAMGQTTDKAENRYATNTLRLRMKDHTPAVRRRKVSVPELGPMTTVHETSMDSPTLPGRPSLHERSASAPGHGWKQHHIAFQSIGERAPTPSDHVARTPPSPKDLPPLKIPGQISAFAPLKQQTSFTRLRNWESSADPVARSAKSDDSFRSRPYTPLSACQTATTPLSATSWYSAMTPISASAPLSAILDIDDSPSPKTCKPEAVLFERTRDQLPDKAFVEPTQVPRAETPNSSTSSHRRNISESGSIMDRGRPRKKSDTSLKQAASLASKGTERRAFEQLPKGWRMADAVQMLDLTEISALHRQALQQLERFEVLKKTDVDSLSRELRNLDERCEYLRRTYHSLRAGRRNLHSRICQCLRSPRTVKFSQDALLKQEEALGELDASIDDWVSKLEQAENRRTRVRQKLLEHVAAAVALSDRSTGAGGSRTPFTLDTAKIQTRAVTTPTPPRSPIRVVISPHTSSSSSSPSRVVAQVPLTIAEQPLVQEEAAASAVGLGIEPVAADEPCTAGIRRADVESIRIYAGDEVAALLADVEEQITQM